MLITHNSNQLVALHDTTEFVLEPYADVRGRRVRGSSGEDLGTVHDLLIDQAENKVRGLIVNHGHLFGKTTSLIPVDAITSVTDDEVTISHDKKTVTGSGVYDPTLVYEEDYYTDFYGYWGYSPYWYNDYVYPRYPYWV